MLTDPQGNLTDAIHLTNAASKGRSGRIIPMNKELRAALPCRKSLYGNSAFVIKTERAERTPSYTIMKKFTAWYRRLGFVGASSHSGRRTAITDLARHISSVDGGFRDVQHLAGHSALGTTQRCIEHSQSPAKKVVDP